MEMDTKKPLIDFIKKTIPNIPIHDEAVQLIADQFEIWNLSKNEFLLKEGRISGYYFLLEGCLRSFAFDNGGNEITTSFYQGCRIVFEPASFFQHLPSEENIQAITDCKGFYSTFEKLNVLFHSTPEFREFARAIIVNEFVAHKKQMLAMINKHAEERYANLMQHNKEIFQVAQLRHIASFLGVTDTSLSRIRRDYGKK
jgi:CRP-like cAMP-binding protein